MANSSRIVEFGPFRLDVDERRLLRDGRAVAVSGKAFDTLCVLVQSGGRLLSKDQLFAAVWPDAAVEDGNLTYTISTLRKALGDNGSSQKYIETVPRQGYRFVAPLRRVSQAAPYTDTVRSPLDVRARPNLFGREHNLEILRAAYAKTQSGIRQTVFLTGDAGMGKTSLVKTFVSELAEAGGVAIAIGECVEHKAQAEPYLPMLNAITQLATVIPCEELHDVLARHAPTWLAQLSWLATPADADTLKEAQSGLSRERMLREIAQALSILAKARSVVIVLEDVHWCDHATVDLLSLLARQTTPSRLLLIATYRAADAKATLHPLHLLMRELTMRHRATEIALELMHVSHVREWLNHQFGSHVADLLAPVLHARTEGNPLFIETMLQSWIDGGQLREDDGEWHVESPDLALDPPESLREFITQQLRTLPSLQSAILEAGAVAASQFCTAVIVGALPDNSPEEVESACAAMAHSNTFFQADGTMEFPQDGTVCDRYRFKHSLFSDIIYTQVTAVRRVRLHAKIAQTLEHLYGNDSGMIAGDLARHCTESRDIQRALTYLELAATQSARQCAYRDAIVFLDKALGLLRRVPGDAERDRRELVLQSMRGPALMATRGFKDPDAEHAFGRAIQLARQVQSPLLFPAVFGMAAMLEFRGDFRASQAMMEPHLAVREREGKYGIECRHLLACSTFHQGQFATALDHALRALSNFSEVEFSDLLVGFNENPGVECYGWVALCQWFLGKPDQAVESAQRALRIAEMPQHSYALANARAQLALVHQLRREVKLTLYWAGETIQLGEEQGAIYRIALGHVLRGWARVESGEGDHALDEIRSAIDTCTAIGAELDRPYMRALLSEALMRLRRTDEALEEIDAGLEQVKGSRSFFYEAELWRLRGEILAAEGKPGSTSSVERAIEVAKSQNAAAPLLRALMSKAKLASSSVEHRNALTELRAALASFVEGLDTPDLVAVQQMLGSERMLGRNARGA